MLRYIALKNDLQRNMIVLRFKGAFRSFLT